MKEMEYQTIGEIVAEDYRTAPVFQSLGVDYCCKGNRTLSEVCDSMGIETEVVMADLNAATKQKVNAEPEYQSWPADKLADHIQNKHHRYVEEKIPLIMQNLEKLCNVHGLAHPELFEIAEQFNLSSGELAMHMKKEELVLFPFIKNMVASKEKSKRVSKPYFDTVQNPIKMMKHEHDIEGARFQRINELTDGYVLPKDACNTYGVTFAMLKEFEEDLHLHIHLENNILFPMAIEMEKVAVV